MNPTKAAALTAALIILSAPCAATTIAGVQVAPAFQSDVGELRLLACTVRNTLWINHYVAALYAPQASSAARLRHPGTPKALRMHIIEDRFLPKDLPDKWREPLKRKLQPSDFEEVRKVFSGVVTGDVITLLYVPGTGAILAVNGGARLSVQTHAHAIIDTILERWVEDDQPGATTERFTNRSVC